MSILCRWMGLCLMGIMGLVLFLFGGRVINDFALILLIGIVVGTYSSIFIASPIALLAGSRKK